MAIQPINSGNVVNSVAQTKPAQKNTASSQTLTVESAASNDTVSITNGISSASDNNTSTASVDEKRVASIKTALQSGDYKINPEQVASKMMAFDKLLQPNTT